MKINRIGLTAGAAGLALVAACSSSGSPASSSAASAPASPPSYSDSQACSAFHDVITIGIPAGQGKPGEDTMTWLDQQQENDNPALQNLISAFISAWGNPADTAAINQAQTAVSRYCGEA